MNEGFCRRLQHLRERRRVKRGIMSELCGLDHNAVAMYERGERIPTAQALEAMADYLGVSMDYLWLGEKNI